MTKATLGIIYETMKTLGLNYDLELWTGDNVQTYFVGEYEEVPMSTEDGFQESSFILTGVTTGKRITLEDAKEKIEKHFGIGGKTYIADNGTAVAISYANSFMIPTGGTEFKKVEIHLDVKEWKVSE